MAIQSGDLCYVRYQGYPGVVHARLALSQVDGTNWVIATPDRDVYVEDLCEANPDFSSFWHVPDGRLPRAIPRGQVYAFGAMTGQEYAMLQARGRREAEAELLRRGPAGHPVPSAPPVPAAAGPAGDPAEDSWVLCEMVPGHKVGEKMAVPTIVSQDGKHGLLAVLDDEGSSFTVRVEKVKNDDLGEFCEKIIQRARNMESLHGEDNLVAPDVRIMPVTYGANGERSRDFKSTIQQMQQCEFEDFPLEPRTCLEYLKAVGEIAESCYGQHLAWVQQSRIPEGDRAIFEDEVLSRIIDIAIKYDALNVCNLACMEMLVRRKQLLAEAHVGSPSAPSYEASDYFMGMRYRPGGGIVVPSLSEHVSRRMHEDSQILKEKRKLKESKESKGKGKSKDIPASPKPDGGDGKK